MNQQLLEEWLEKRKVGASREVLNLIEELLFDIEFSIFEGEDSA